jgi:TRAP-type mannitol/chloroaromatic compound transport system permease small subunit
LPVRAIVSAIETITRLLGYLAAVLVLVLMSLMVYEVVMRYVFGAPTIWSYDLSTMTLGAIFVLSIAYTLMTDSHVRIDILHPFLGRHAKPVIDLIGLGLVMLPLLVWLCWGLWDYFHAALLSMERTGASAWNPLVWPFRAVMFIGVAAWTLQVLAEIAKAAFQIAGRPLVESDRPVPLE